MSKIEVKSFFYDLIHCKDKILSTFKEWDEKYVDDERGAIVAGIREAEDSQLVHLLINIQRMAEGYEQIQEMIAAAEHAEMEKDMEEDDEDAE